MVAYVKEVVSFARARLTAEERSLLSVAYKNRTGQLRNGWRVVSQIEDAEKSRSSATRRESLLAQRERQVIEKDILDVCLDVLGMLDSTLIPAARPGDETVFYYKMYNHLLHQSVSLLICVHRKGDYLRYLAELGRGDIKEEYAIASLDAYKLAYKLAMNTLEPTHPTRLGLALNFSVYFRDVLNSPERACHLAKHAFDEAVAVLDQESESTTRDSIMILQLLRDDLILWYKEIQERGESLPSSHVFAKGC